MPAQRWAYGRALKKERDQISNKHKGQRVKTFSWAR